MRFRADEHIAPNVIPNSASDVAHKMVRGCKIRAAKEIAGKERLIEAGAGNPDSSLEFSRQRFIELGCPDSIEVIKNWAEWLDSLVDVLFRSPGCFKADSKVMSNQKVGAKSRECSASHRLRLEIDRGA